MLQQGGACCPSAINTRSIQHPWRLLPGKRSGSFALITELNVQQQGVRSLVANAVEVPLAEVESWHVPWGAKLPGGLLAALMSLAWILHIRSGGMASWGISSDALRHGRYATIGLHMFAHGGLFHIAMNSLVLFAISGPVVARLGNWPESWLRYIALFLVSGLAGALAYLLLHPFGNVPMLGASGAIYGILGLLLRLEVEGDELVPLRSPKMRIAAVAIIKENFWMLLLMTLPPLLSGKSGGLAWEAHLGGLLLGLIVGPWFLPKSNANKTRQPSVDYEFPLTQASKDHT